MFKAAGVLGGAALFVGALAANPAHSRGVAEEEEDSLSTRALKMVGLHSWFVWAVEPAEKAGCPPGTLLADPPELPPGMIQRTLVLSLEDTLIHTQWDRQRGHRTQKRPGLDAFLAHMSQFYEIIIFTSAMQTYAQPIAAQLQEQ
ncbi:NLI interacting factor-like phosphatase-domain-containing protein, partial [Baffinella frigidus]